MLVAVDESKVSLLSCERVRFQFNCLFSRYRDFVLAFKDFCVVSVGTCSAFRLHSPSFFSRRFIILYGVLKK